MSLLKSLLVYMVLLLNKHKNLKPTMQPKYQYKSQK